MIKTRSGRNVHVVHSEVERKKTKYTAGLDEDEDDIDDDDFVESPPVPKKYNQRTKKMSQYLMKRMMTTTTKRTQFYATKVTMINLETRGI